MRKSFVISLFVVCIIVAIAQTVEVVSGVNYEWWQYALLVTIWISAGFWFNLWRKKDRAEEESGKS